jgi:hypothetical protein
MNHKIVFLSVWTASFSPPPSFTPLSSVQWLPKYNLFKKKNIYLQSLKFARFEKWAGKIGSKKIGDEKKMVAKNFYNALAKKPCIFRNILVSQIL